MSKGKVYLVGAGPGDPELITLKALNVLKRADVVVYDWLISDEIIELFPPKAERIFVGKTSGRHTMPQSEINELILRKANEGRIVVRLKGGDPFLFGRGGEEAEVLTKAGARYEVIPGVSTALAVPAYAGIPLTHREYASSVAIATGHEMAEKGERCVNWRKLAGSADTLVVLMGVKRMGWIVQELILGGIQKDTPAAIVERGTTSRQRVITAPLAAIADEAAKHQIGPPAVIIVGNVVKLREQLSWFRGDKHAP
ncbi:MAG: uroporphyrinogen-III C-methyltransferase [Candidatus Bathyarchaeia archaeon]